MTRAKLLNPADARIFRITHIDNVPWILDHGLCCQSSSVRDPNFVPIGMTTLIQKRTTYPVPVPPGGVLADYVPFYFTPWSPMLLNIKTGWGDVVQRPNEEIVIIGARLRDVAAAGYEVVFTDGHACGLATHETSYFTDLDDLDRIDWELLRAKDSKHDPDDPGKRTRYMAEAMIRKRLRIDAIGGIECNTPRAKARVDQWIATRSLDLGVTIKPDWYF
jgi:hypothetical protein